jgi:uncharacterized membrane protein YeaQ/YmgE (transglycosylase-associated protein family)
MGLYVWIALGCVVGVIARLLTPKRLFPSWLALISVGIAGSVTGGWIGTRIWNSGTGINNMAVPAMVAAVVGAVVLLGIYLAFVRRKPTDEVRAEEKYDDERHIA